MWKQKIIMMLVVASFSQESPERILSQQSRVNRRSIHVHSHQSAGTQFFSFQILRAQYLQTKHKFPSPYPYLSISFSNHHFLRFPIQWQSFCQYSYNQNFGIILPSAEMAEQHYQRHSKRTEKIFPDPQGQRPFLGAFGGLHDEVIRKNNEIIRNFLTKLSEVFARQEQYEAGTKAIHEKLAKLAQSTENLQYEFQSSFLENSRKHSQLGNDIAVIKNALKIPSISSPHQVYLSSDFFRERVNGVNSRMRDNASRGWRKQRTNFGGSGGVEKEGVGSGSRVSVQQQPIFSNNQNTGAPKKHGKNRSQLPTKQLDQQLSKTSDGYLRHSDDSLQLLSHHADITPQVEELREKLEEFITKSALQSSISLLREDLQQKMQNFLAGRKTQCDWNHIDFHEIQSYVDTKVQQALADKVGRKYFEASLNNLKEAWQQEEKTIYEAIGNRAQAYEVSALREKITELALKLEHPLSTPKPNNIFLNATLSPFLGKHGHHRVSARDMHLSDSPDTTLIGRRGEDTKKSRLNLQYTNSLSMCRSVDKKETKTTPVTFEDLTVSQAALKERAWREKVTEALGEQKMKKKTKNMN